MKQQGINMRLTLDEEEIFDIKRGKVPNSVLLKIEKEENKPTSPKLIKAMTRAREKRTKDTLKKIEKALGNMIMFPDKKITVYSVAQEAGVSYNTVNKSEQIKEMIYQNEKMRMLKIQNEDT
jgi:UDP-glucose 6-dehydrogenase